MGFLKAGKPLSWTDSLEYTRYVREQGIKQFLDAYFKILTRKNDVLLWGDEIEYHIVHFDEEERRPRVALVAPQVIRSLEQSSEEETATNSASRNDKIDRHLETAWRPEYGAWMVEATPGRPYGNLTTDLPLVQLNMARRRSQIQKALHSLVPSLRLEPCSIVCFPMLGVGDDYTTPRLSLGGPYSRSRYFSDGAICPHPRFGTLTANIRRRRGERVNILLPLYRDRNTDTDSTVLDLDNSSTATCVDGTAVQHDYLSQARLEEGKVEATGVRPAGCLDHTNELQAEKESGFKHEDFTGDVTRSCDFDTDEKTRLQTDLFPHGHVHLDAMGFGMGCCCLQVTFQARDVKESRYLYDQLAVLSPLVMALTANTAIVRGRLVDVDTRWDVIAASVDCRTSSERKGAFGMEGLDHNVETYVSQQRRDAARHAPNNRLVNEEANKSASKYTSTTEPPGTFPLTYWQKNCEYTANAAAAGCRPLKKSRYGSIDLFISDSDALRDEYNDVYVEKDEDVYNELINADIDSRLASHISHLFVRDPLVIFSDRINVEDDPHTTEHFENVQSTNWHSVRWKPPPSGSEDTGVRVEFRTLEAQLTDFENAAFTVFTVLASRVILFFDLNLYIPISKVDENFARARTKDAATEQKFFFRKHVVPLRQRCPEMQEKWAQEGSGESGETEMSLNEILLGKHDYPGLIPLIFAYLDIIQCDSDTRAIVDVYMRLIADRARGNVKTGARWQRDFIERHPLYKAKQDSVVPPQVAYDLLEQCSAIAKGEVEDQELLGEYAMEVERALRRKGGVGWDDLGKRLRGASFAEEVLNSPDCEVVHELIAAHCMKPGSTFESTPGFLSGEVIDDERSAADDLKLNALASRLQRR
eukprot:gb/GECG01015315.1/.p1 GENE.gb/GECG01015315.1/~~gb/GECG01015315.1/.p1  ORF type:complete len:872 (+),score=96.63 gb/GECG01015315.1/:1-2616(+)